MVKKHVLQTNRRKSTRELNKKVMIYCEGETEKQYFDMLSKKYSKTTVTSKRISVKTKVMGNKNPLNLVKEAIRTLEHDRRKNHIDLAYVVFDNDDHSDGEISEAMQLAERNKLEVIYSNTAFDLWILLHFEPVYRYMTKQNIYDKLTEKFNVVSYQNELKGKDLSKFIEDLVIVAFKNAERVIADGNKVRNCIKVNPFVNLHKHLKRIYQVEKV